MKMRWRIFLTCLTMASVMAAPAFGAHLGWHVIHGLAPVHPEDPADAFLAAHETSPRMSAAWGEGESLYLFLAAQEEDIEAATLSVGSFAHESWGALAPSCFGLHWCDERGSALQNAAIPARIERGKGRWARLDWTAPVDAEAGTYTGWIRFQSEAIADSLALLLQIWEFDRPRSAPIHRMEQGSAPTIEAIAFGEESRGRARVQSKGCGDLPGPGAGPLSARVLPLAAWLAGLNELVIEGADAVFELHYEDGLDDLAYMVLLREDPSLLAERIAALLPVRDLIDWDQDPSELLHWRLAAGAFLSGEERIALDLVREMESLRSGARGHRRSLADAEGPAWGWKRARKIEALADDGLRLTLDADRSTARFTSRPRDWRRDGFLEMELKSESGNMVLELVLEQAGFRKKTWSYRLHLREGETRKLNVPLPREAIDLGKVNALKLRLIEAEAEAATFQLRNLALR